MGYTHYFPQLRDFSEEEWDQLCKDVRKIIDSCNVTVKFECDSDEPPQINEECIRFNGEGGDGHETFLITKKQTVTHPIIGTFRFCKTARKPYDEIVTLVLLHIFLKYPDSHHISSDGEWEGEWQSTVEQYCEIFEIKKESIRCPWYHDYSQVTIPAKGRFGQKRPNASARLTLEEDGSISIRIDDAENLEFWAEFTIPELVIEDFQQIKKKRKLENK